MSKSILSDLFTPALKPGKMPFMIQKYIVESSKATFINPFLGMSQKSKTSKGSFLSESLMRIKKLHQITMLSRRFEYRTRAIITRGLYTFYPLFEVQKRFFKGLFSYNSGLMYG